MEMAMYRLAMYIYKLNTLSVDVFLCIIIIKTILPTTKLLLSSTYARCS